MVLGSIATAPDFLETPICSENTALQEVPQALVLRVWTPMVPEPSGCWCDQT